MENLSTDELVDEVLSLEYFKNGINVRFSQLNNRFNDFEVKYEMVNSNLSITRLFSVTKDILLSHSPYRTNVVFFVE